MDTKVSEQDSVRTEFLRAAGALLAEMGERGLSIEAVTSWTGYSAAQFHRYFATVEDLLFALVRSDEFLPGVPELLADFPADPLDLPPRDRVGAYLKAYARALRRRPATVQTILHAIMGDQGLTGSIVIGRNPKVIELRSSLHVTDDETGFDMGLLMIMFISMFLVLAAQEMHLSRAMGCTNGDELWRRTEAIIDSLLASPAS